MPSHFQGCSSPGQVKSWGPAQIGFVEEDDPLYEAAEDLLELCKEALAEIRRLIDYYESRGPLEDELCVRMEKVIAKATHREEDNG